MEQEQRNIYTGKNIIKRSITSFHSLSLSIYPRKINMKGIEVEASRNKRCQVTEESKTFAEQNKQSELKEKSEMKNKTHVILQNCLIIFHCRKKKFNSCHCRHLI